MKEKQIETERIAGDITLVLKRGTTEEKQSLLAAIEEVSGVEERLRLEAWMASEMEGA